MSTPGVNSRDGNGHVLEVPEAPSAERPRSTSKLDVSPEAIRVLPAEFVKRHRILPLGIRDGTIHVATADPGNQRVIDDIRLLSGLEVKESQAPSSEILEKIAECYQLTVEQMLENLNR